MKKNILFLCSLLCCWALSAQTVDFDLPQLAGQNYSIHLFKRTTTDTIARGKFDANGKLHFAMPEKYKDYVGMLHISFGQGGQNVVMNKESFSVTFSPLFNDIVYSNSVENDFLKKQFKIRQPLVAKYEVIARAQAVYADDSELLPVFQKEFARLNELYINRQQEVTSSKSYAAQYIQFIEFLNGLGSRFYAQGQDAAKVADLDSVFRTQLDMDCLYTSGLWNHVISTTFNLYPSPTVFGEAMVAKFKKIRSQEVFNALANDLVTICEQYGWTEAENVIYPYLVESGRLEDPRGRLYLVHGLSKIKPGNKAPAIEGEKNLSNTLLFFYESGCSNCQKQLAELKNHYAAIQKKGIRVITISADTNEDVFNYNSKDFPWPNKRCDFQGFEGPLFKNYGVVATPTLYTIDKKGNIEGRYATLEETKLMD
jgi:hypothetical protein